MKVETQTNPDMWEWLNRFISWKSPSSYNDSVCHKLETRFPKNPDWQNCQHDPSEPNVPPLAIRCGEFKLKPIFMKSKSPSKDLNSERLKNTAGKIRDNVWNVSEQGNNENISSWRAYEATPQYYVTRRDVWLITPLSEGADLWIHLCVCKCVLYLVPRESKQHCREKTQRELASDWIMAQEEIHTDKKIRYSNRFRKNSGRRLKRFSTFRRDNWNPGVQIWECSCRIVTGTLLFWVKSDSKISGFKIGACF